MSEKRTARKYVRQGWQALATLPRVPVLPVAAAALLLLATGWGYGIWTQRWQTSNELTAAAQRIDVVPWTIGAWKGAAVAVEPEAIKQAGLAACWMRTYTGPAGTTPVTVVLMCGRSGPTCVHSPQWCYGGAGYEMTVRPERQVVALEKRTPAQFWTARFLKESPVAPEWLRICWAWSADGSWQAPDYPRVTFAGRPALYKLYFIRAERGLEPADAGPDEGFMRRFLTELNQSLFPSVSEVLGGPDPSAGP